MCKWFRIAEGASCEPDIPINGKGQEGYKEDQDKDQGVVDVVHHGCKGGRLSAAGGTGHQNEALIEGAELRQ